MPSISAHETLVHSYCQSLLAAPQLSVFASWQYAVMRPLSMLVEIIILKCRNLASEGACSVGSHGVVVGPTVDQVRWAYGEVQQYFEDGIVRWIDQADDYRLRSDGERVMGAVERVFD